MNFESMLVHLKNGERCARSGWNGKDMWIKLVPGREWAVSSHHISEPLSHDPWIGLKTISGSFVPWLASQTDILAEDWGLASVSLLTPQRVMPTGIAPGKVHDV